MSALPDFYAGTVVATALLLIALALAPLAHRAWLPEPAAFLAVGVVAGALGLQPAGDLSPLELQEIGSLALYAVLFQGGLSTGWAAWRRHARVIGALGLPGTAATAALVALAGAGLGLSWEAAILVGVALAPTDPAAVYATLRHRGETPARTILEGESGFNDPVGIAMMAAAVAAIGASGSGGGAALRLVEELGLGLVGGLVGAALVVLVLRFTPQLDDGLQAVAVLGVAVLVAAGTAAAPRQRIPRDLPHGSARLRPLGEGGRTPARGPGVRRGAQRADPLRSAGSSCRALPRLPARRSSGRH